MAENSEVGMRCIKWMLLSITGMFVLSSALIISVGTTIFAIYHDFSFFLEANYFSPASFVIAIGVIMLFVSLLGCIGALKESTCLVNVFAVILSMVLILEISAAIAAYSLRNDVHSLLEYNLRSTMPYYKTDPEVQAAFDFTQSKLGCCGIDSFEDWKQLGDALTGAGIFVGSKNVTVPDSCCAGTQTYMIDGFQFEECVQMFANGCLPRVILLIYGSAGLLGTGALTIAFIQIVGIVFSFMLAKAIRQTKTARERRRWEIAEQMLNTPGGFKDKQPVVYVPYKSESF